MALRKISSIPFFKTLIGPPGPKGDPGPQGPPGKDGVTSTVVDTQSLETLKSEIERSLLEIEKKLQKLKKKANQDTYPTGGGTFDPALSYSWTGTHYFANKTYFGVPTTAVSQGAAPSAYFDNVLRVTGEGVGPALALVTYGPPGATYSVPAFPTDAFTIGTIAASGWGGAAFNAGAVIQFKAFGGDWSETSRPTRIEIETCNVGETVPSDTLVLNPDHSITAVNGISISGGVGDYADDAAAASGGVPVGKFYRTGSVLKIRVS